jgi:hypothetical protein
MAKKTKRERDAAQMDRDYERAIDRLQATREALDRELARRFAEEKALEALLVASRTRRGRPLTEGGRKVLLRRYSGAVTRVAVAMCELDDVCTRLGLKRDSRRMMAWRMREAA